MTDKLIKAGELELLSGGMDSAEGRPERDHIEVRELLEEQTALEAGVDGKNERLSPEAFLVGLYAHLEDV